MAGSCQHLKPDESPSPFSPFHEGISMLLSRWTALQMAVQNQWGGRDSFMKSQQLAYEINSWFSQPKVVRPETVWFNRAIGMMQCFTRSNDRKRALLLVNCYINTVSLHIEDLESLLHERLLLSFNTEIEDGSIEEIAEQLMTMHEESLHGNRRLSVESNQHLLESAQDAPSKRTGAHSLAT
nr:pre-rRNA-processing protein TSR2-like [Coffea arabica]